MAQIILKQGESEKAELLVLNNNVAVDLTTANDIRITLKVNTSSTVVDAYKYSKNPVPNYGICRVDGLVNNKIIVEIERSQSRPFPIGSVSFNVLISFPDAEFTSGYRWDEYNFTNIGTIIKGEQAAEPIP